MQKNKPWSNNFKKCKKVNVQSACKFSKPHMYKSNVAINFITIA